VSTVFILGLLPEPPIGIESMTDALRVRSGLLLDVALVLVELLLRSVVARRCSPAWLLGWLLGLLLGWLLRTACSSRCPTGAGPAFEDGELAGGSGSTRNDSNRSTAT
jgi:hypothetical protein